MKSEYPEFTDLTSEQAKAFIRDSKNWALRKKMQQLVKSVGGSVLDVACGNGIDADRFPSCDYMGVDLSAPLIEAARLYCPNHTFKVMDATELQLPDNSFKSVFCIGLFEHVRAWEDIRQIVAEMLRVSSKKVFLGWHRSPEDKFETSFIKKAGHYGLTCNSNYYNRREFCEKTGITLAKEHIVNDFRTHRYSIWEIDSAKTA